MADDVNLVANLILKMNPAQINALGAQLGPALNQAAGPLGKLNAGFAETNRQASYLSVRLSSFAAYRGFVFLEQGIISSTRAMIALDHEISLVMTQLPNFGKGLRGALTDEVIKVSKQTGETFQEVASALYEITSAGYSGAEAMKALDLSARAAVAGGTSTTAAFQSAFSQLSAFGLGIDKLSEVYDKQFQLVKRGIFTYEQLTHIVGVTAEAMDKAGQSIETNNAALATMSEVFTGPQLMRGATALRAFTNAIADSPDDFAALGIATRDINGNIRALIPILEDLKAKTAGMATGERASFFATLLPDQREQLALGVLIDQMDDLKRNWVEQKLALGSLDAAYKVVHGDIQTQTKALVSNLQSGFRPLATTVGLFAEGLNNVEKVLPGITSNLVVMTTAVLAASLAWGRLAASAGEAGVAAYMASQFAMRPGATGGVGFSMMPGAGGRFSPLARGGSFIAAGVTGAVAANRSSGDFSGADFWGGLAASAGAGAAAGGIMGAGTGPGAAVTAGIGALASSASFVIQEWAKSTQNTFEEGGKTFADSFSGQMRANHGNVNAAVASAIGLTGADGSAFDLRTPSMRPVSTTDSRNFEANRSYLEGNVFRRKSFLDEIFAGLQTAGGQINHLFGADTTYTKYGKGPGLAELAPKLRGELLAYDKSTKAPLAAGLISQADYDEARDGIVADFLALNLSTKGLSEEQAKAQGTLRGYLVSMTDATLSSSEFAALVDDATRNDLPKFVDDLAHAGDSAKAMAKDVLAAFSGDFSGASAIFDHMGDEGENLAKVFQRMAKAMGAAESIKLLEGLSVNGKNPLSGMFDFGEAKNAIAKYITNQVGAIPNIRDDALSGAISFGEYSAQRKSNTDKLVASLFKEDEATVSLASNSLADSLFAASEMVRDGFVDGMGFTADQLEMLGEEFLELNKTVGKVRLLMELQGIGEFLGLPKDFLEPLKTKYLNEAKVNGQSLRDLLSNPDKLIEFISNIEFGDISIDQSQNNNFVFRFSGDSPDPSRAAEFYDAVIAEANSRSRKRSS